MTGFEFALLLLAWAIGGASPGPATLAIASTAMSQGRMAGIAGAAGIVAGSAFWGIAAALGMSALMQANVWLVEVLRYAGATYILYLAYKAGKSALTDKPLASLSTTAHPLHHVFRRCLLIHLTNPKAIFGWGALFAVAIEPGASDLVLIETFAAFISVSCLVFFGYGLLFSTPRMIRGYAKMRRWFEASFAVLFGLAGLKILTTRIAV